MQLTAKLTKILPLQTGTSAKGEWKKQEIIVDLDGKFPKKICISIWGDKIDETVLQIGNMLTIDFDVESREFNERWYTEVKAWKIETTSPANSNPSDNVSIPQSSILDQEESDLPF